MNPLTFLSAINANKLPQADPSEDTLQNVLQVVFGVAGAIALLIITIAGLKYATSRGDANAIKSAKETIIYAIAGLLITLTAYGIVTFVFNEAL